MFICEIRTGIRTDPHDTEPGSYSQEVSYYPYRNPY